MFDLHDVCDLIRTRITQLHEIAEAEGDDADTDTAFMIRQWTRALEAVRDAARQEQDATAADDDVRCSCCGKSQDEVQRMVAARDAGAAAASIYLCDGCIGLLHDLIHDDD